MNIQTARQIIAERGAPKDVPADLPEGLKLGRIKNADQALQQFDPDFVRLMGDHCLRADELGYELYISFRDKDQNSSWKLFEQALEHGIDSVDNPGPALVRFFDHLDNVPDWVDYDQIYRGAVAFWRAGPLVPMVLAYSVIGVGFTGYASSRPVLFSGRMVTRNAVGQRLLESFRFIAHAYTPGGMTRFSEGFKLTVRVRMIHAAVRFTLSRMDEWDWRDWGIPINNFDATDTQAGQFGVEVVDSLAKSGVKLNKQEREDLFALTRFVGYVIGVPEEILHTNEAQAREIHALHGLLETPADEGCRKIFNGIVDYSCEESFGGYDVLPPPLAKFMTPERRKKLSRGLLCGWQPQSIIDQFEIEPDIWRFAVPVSKPFVWLYDRYTRLTPEKDEARAFGVIQEFEKAIATAKGERALAEPEQLTKDVKGNAHLIENHLKKADARVS